VLYSFVFPNALIYMLYNRVSSCLILTVLSCILVLSIVAFVLKSAAGSFERNIRFQLVWDCESRN
jgi:uncharacterized membrane protein